MTPGIDSQELARRFNEEDAVWQRYAEIRKARRRCGTKSFLPEEVLDNLDWQKAEQECRAVRVIGFLARSR